MLSEQNIECPAGLLTRAQALPASRAAIAGADSSLALRSVRLAVDAGLVLPILVGEPDVIRRHADALDWDVAGFEIIAASGDAEAAAGAAAIAGAGDADLLVKGHVHTDAFMLAILKREAGLRTGRRLTHVFHMTLPGHERALMIADAAVNVAPPFETRQQILANAVRVARALGVEEPHVAVLSGTEEVTKRMPSSVEAAELAAWATDALPEARVHGPLAFDNAVSGEAARIKGIEHPVAGNADILIVPSIEAGNALYKMMVYFMGACAAGVVMGAKVPAVLTSRADPPAARLASIALAAVLAHAQV